MLLNILSYLANNLLFFTGAYSNNVFPEQLPKDKEEELIKKMQNGDKDARNTLIEQGIAQVGKFSRRQCAEQMISLFRGA